MARLFLVVIIAGACHAALIPPGAKLIPYKIARRAAQRLSLDSEQEWNEWVMDNKPGVTSRYEWLMPDEPHLAYPEWKSWDDWLGHPLPFEEARAEVAQLGITGQEHWWAYTREYAELLQDLRVPSRPHLFYKKLWQGYDHWLSLPESELVLPKDWPGADLRGQD